MISKVKHPGFRNFIRHYLLKVIFAFVIIELLLIAYFQGRNRIPVVQDDQATVSTGQSIDIPVLANDSDKDIEDKLVIETVSDPEHGKAEVLNRVIRYTPDSGFTGTDRFNYTVSDSEDHSKPAVVTVTVESVSES